jgi:ATP:ADP antiporter, AAA family
MKLFSWLRQSLGIAPEELPLVGRLWGHAFSMGITRLFTSAAAKALFLSKYPAESLAYVYLGVAIFVSIVGIFYLQLKKRISFRNLLPLCFAFIFIIEICFRGILEIPEWNWPALAIMIWFEIEFMLSGLAFWSLCNNLLDVRQGKRLFGFIGSGEVLAIVLAGVSTRFLAPLLGSLNLLFLSLAGTGLSFYFNYSISRKWMKETPFVVQKKPTISKNSIQSPSGVSSYLNSIYFLALFSLLGYYFVDNMFQRQARAQYPKPEDLSIFFGQFLAFAGGLSFLVRIFVVGPLLNRYGLNLGLLAPPLLVLSCTSVLLFSWFIESSPYLIFILAVVLRIFDKLGRDALQKPSLLILYQPLPESERQNVQAKVESLIEPMSAGLAGIILISINILFPQLIWLSILLLFFVLGIWIFIASPLPKKYRTLLEKALTRRRMTDSNISLQDGLSLELIQKGLQSPHAGEIIYSLNLLESAKTALLEETLKKFISHPILEVRLDCLERMERLKLHSLIPIVKENILVESDPKIKGNSIRLLSYLDSTEMTSMYRDYLQHPEWEVRQGAMIGLLLREGFNSHAGTILESWVKSSNFIDRKISVQVIGELKLNSAIPLLKILLEDTNNVVRKSALIVSGQLKSLDLWDSMFLNLKVPAMRKTTILAFSHLGEQILFLMEKQFFMDDQTSDIKLAIAEIYGQINTQASMSLLKEKIEFSDKSVRHQIFKSLKKCNYIASPEDFPKIKKLIYREVENSAKLLGILIDISDTEELSILKRSLEFEVSQNKERIFLLLGFIYPVEGIALAREHLSGIPGGKRSYAIELIDQIVEVQLKSWIVPVLESNNPATCLERLGGEFLQAPSSLKAQLEEIIKTDTSVTTLWTKACSFYLIGKLKLLEFKGLLLSYSKNSDPLLSETIRQSLNRIDTDNSKPNENQEKILTIDRVLILKNIRIFSHTPDEYLASVAGYLDELKVKHEEIIFERGNIGRSLYIIVEGKVKLHNQDVLLGTLSTNEVFGEWAALDPEPRAASVTALEDSTLFKLEHEALYDLMSSDIEIVRGIIHILCQNLRNVTEEI